MSELRISAALAEKMERDAYENGRGYANAVLARIRTTARVSSVVGAVEACQQIVRMIEAMDVPEDADTLTGEQSGALRAAYEHLAAKPTPPLSTGAASDSEDA